MADDWDSFGGAAEEKFEFDGTGRTSEGGNNVDREGWYHFEVADVVKDLTKVSANGKPKAQSMRFDMLVMHPVEGQSPQGARLFHRITLRTKEGQPPKEGSFTAMINFLTGLGLLGQVDDPEVESGKSTVELATGSKKFNIVEVCERAKGLQCIAKIVFEKGEGNYPDRWSIPYGRVFAIDDPAVVSVPRNKAAAKLAPKPAGATAPAATAKPAAPAPTPVAPSGAEIDEFADL